MEKVIFTFLNVHHGDSIIIEFFKQCESYCCVVDTNTIKKDGSYINPTVNYLRKKNIKKIDALVISHFDKDHILGIENILDNFEIKKLCIPPVFGLQSTKFNELVGKVKSKLEETAIRSKSSEVFQHLKSFAHLIKFIKNKTNLIQELSGPSNSFFISGLGEIGRIFLPLSLSMGEIRQKIINGNFEIRPFPNMNSVSVVIQFNVINNKVLLTGDSTITLWNKHMEYTLRDNITSLNTDYLKIPHHGSKFNNSQRLYEYYFGGNVNGKNVFVSSNGRSHPHADFFTLVKENKLLPHCTNLSHYCVPDLLNVYLVDPIMAREAIPFLINYSIETKPVPCQGDITLELTTSQINISNSTGTRCIYSY